MKEKCQRCEKPLSERSRAYVCSHECTFCADCTYAMEYICPNCGGQLHQRSIIISSNNAEHYSWGDQCDGWHLVQTNELSIIQEKMPPGTSEVKHYHQTTRQFFFVLYGELTIELDGKDVFLARHEGVEIPPRMIHKVKNASNEDVIFTVTSQPTSRGDRIVED